MKNEMIQAVVVKIKVLEQLGYTLTEEQKKHLASSTSRLELDRRARDIIIPPVEREIGWCW